MGDGPNRAPARDVVPRLARQERSTLCEAASSIPCQAAWGLQLVSMGAENSGPRRARTSPNTVRSFAPRAGTVQSPSAASPKPAWRLGPFAYGAASAASRNHLVARGSGACARAEACLLRRRRRHLRHDKLVGGHAAVNEPDVEEEQLGDEKPGDERGEPADAEQDHVAHCRERPIGIPQPLARRLVKLPHTGLKQHQQGARAQEGASRVRACGAPARLDRRRELQRVEQQDGGQQLEE